MKGCRNCTTWDALEEFLDRIDPATQGLKVQIWQCRRYAPRPLTPAAAANGTGDDAGGAESRWTGFWPRVASDDWCGEWDPKLD